MPAASPAMASNEVRFEAARKSAAQREAKSLGEMDAMEPEGGVTQRRVGSRRFVLANGVWTDAAYTSAMRTVTVKPFSSAYFALVQRMGELAAPFALGDRVVVAGRKVAVRLAPDGAEAVETLTPAAIDAIVRDW